MLNTIEDLISSGRYFEAHSLAEEFCEKNPDNLRALQLCGLSMSKSGARLAAIKFLEPVLMEHPQDAETAGILGGVYKEQFKKTADTQYARKSLETYLQNFEKTKSPFTGINAATMSRILGKGKKAKELAAEVIEIASDEDSFWAYSTIGEAYLLKQQPVEAATYYRKAARLGGSHYGNMGSVYAQLLILKHYINVPINIISMFAPPKIAVFAGHMIDNNRSAPRFPEEISDRVKLAISHELKANNIKIGYTSLASGSDIIFVEALLELGGEANIFIPFDRDDFMATSVSFAGHQWVEKFEKIEASQKITYLSKSRHENADVLFQFLGKVMIGAGIMRSSQFHTQPYLLTVASEWDKLHLSGGTNSIRSIWPFPDKLLNINPDRLTNPENNVHDSAGRSASSGFDLARVKHKSINYFVLATLVCEEERDSPEVAEVADKVKAELNDFPGPNRSGITNESVYALYSKANTAVDFAIRLLGWAEHHKVEVRIALEAVLMGKRDDVKSVIEDTSSLKTIAFTGACYATMQFAAALSAEQLGRYDFHHVGVIASGEIDEGQEIYKIERKIQTALS